MIDEIQLVQQIEAAMRANNVPGVGIAIVEDEMIVFEQVVGVQNKQSRPILTESTPFQAASLSKPVFAYLVLKLVEDGTIALDKPLSSYWDGDIYRDDRTKKITPRHVLTHTTGFPNWSDEASSEIIAEPGHLFGYSGEGFEYLQRTVEHVTNKTLQDHARINLFEPLGMDDSSFAWGLDESGGFLMDEDDDVLPITGAEYANAAFSLMTTAGDYARFLLATLHPEDNHPVKLGHAMSMQMLTPQVKVANRDKLSWGFGWGIQHIASEDMFWHWGGGQNNYFNYCLGLPEARKGVVVMTNSVSGQHILDVIANMALGLTVEHPAFRWIRPNHQWRSDAR